MRRPAQTLGDDIQYVIWFIAIYLSKEEDHRDAADHAGQVDKDAEETL